MSELKVVYRKTSDLIPYARNARTHSDEQVARIASSIKEFGFTNPILVDEENGIIAGHGRIAAARLLGMTEVPTINLTGLSETQKKAYILADNKLALDAGWDDEMLRIELEELSVSGALDWTGFSEDEFQQLALSEESDSNNDNVNTDFVKGVLRSKYLIPPLSILNSRSGAWIDRRRKYRSLFKSTEGRDKECLFGNCLQKYKGFESLQGVSEFDPVLCEILINWFSPKGGIVVDPFAGGVVRGAVSAMMGRQYFGNDLRQEQIDANREQLSKFLDRLEIPPVWTVGDSKNICSLVGDIKADFVLSCPPYADLEVYSDDPSDISNMDYPEFLSAYREIISETCSLLKEDRFACFVVSEVRDKFGHYRNFVADTIKAFEDCGLHYYNELILVNAIGSAALRVAAAFPKSRKIGRVHQNVLVFLKGDAKKATEACGICEVAELPEEEAVGE